MPIRNTATLLENIVLVEAFRLLLELSEADRPIEFVNAFAMPPLSPWHDGNGDKGFSALHVGA